LYLYNQLSSYLHTESNSKYIHLIFDGKDDLRMFSGKKGYYNAVKTLFPSINRDMLYDDYFYICKILRSANYFCKDYQQHLNTKHLYPNFKFHYEPSYDDNGVLFGEEFEILDGLILSADDVFWEKYLPPNHIHDRCYYRRVDDNITDVDRRHLPEIDNRFNINFKKIFFGQAQTYEPKPFDGGISVGSLKIDTRGMIERAIKEIGKENGINEKDIEQLLNSI